MPFNPFGNQSLKFRGICALYKPPFINPKITKIAITINPIIAAIFIIAIHFSKRSNIFTPIKIINIAATPYIAANIHSGILGNQ